MVYINKAEAPATMVALSADVYTSNLASMHTSSMLCKCVPKGSVNDIEKVREVEVDLKKKKKNAYCEEIGWKGIAGKLQVREQETQGKN